MRSISVRNKPSKTIKSHFPSQTFGRVKTFKDLLFPAVYALAGGRSAASGPGPALIWSWQTLEVASGRQEEAKRLIWWLKLWQEVGACADQSGQIQIQPWGLGL